MAKRLDWRESQASRGLTANSDCYHEDMTKPPLPPAPGADTHASLALVGTTVALPGGQHADELASPEDATRWLIEHDLVPHETTLLTYCQTQLTGLRAHLRALFDAHLAGEAPPETALDAVNSALRKAPSARTLRHDAQTGFRRETAHPVTQLVEHAMAQISEDAATLLAGDEADLLARCEAPACDRIFLRTHARRRWCSTRCGDRVRAARAYANQTRR